MADVSPQVKVDVPFVKGLIPAYQLGVATNFLNEFVTIDRREYELSRVCGSLKDVTHYLLKHWHGDPILVLAKIAEATTYGE